MWRDHDEGGLGDPEAETHCHVEDLWTEAGNLECDPLHRRGHRAAVGLFEHGGLAYCAAARHEGVVCRLTSPANFAAFSFIRW